MTWLRQSTPATVKIGPFLDDTDGKTPETGLAISQADVRLSHNGGAFAPKHDTSSCTHDENGWYACPLDATDLETVGRLTVAVHASGALPVWHSFLVLPADVYDGLVSGVVFLPVNAMKIENGDPTDVVRDAVVDDATRIDASALNTLSAHDPGTTLGTAKPGDAMALTPEAREEIDATLAAAHGAGRWDLALGGAAALVTQVAYVTSEDAFLTLRRGDNPNIVRLTLYDAHTRLPLNLSGYTVYLTVKHPRHRGDADDANALFSVEGAVLGEDGNIVQFEIPAADTDKMQLGEEYDYDVEARAGPTVTTLVCDRVALLHDVRRGP